MAEVAEAEAAEVGRESGIPFTLLACVEVGTRVHVSGGAVVGEDREGGHNVLSVD